MVVTWSLLAFLINISGASTETSPTCLLELRPSSRNAVIGGIFACSGGTISAALHPDMLPVDGPFQLKGAKLGPRSCLRPDCLITICSDSTAVIHANVTGISIPDAAVPAVICQMGRGHLHFKRPVFIGNNASALYIGQDATARIDDGLFRDAVVPSGAGFVARGRSKVVVNRSQFLNNTSTGWWAGPAFISKDNSTVTVQDRSLIQGNHALDEMCGGAFATYETSTTIIRGHTVIDNNNASAAGGAIAVFAASRLEMTQAIVTNNKAIGPSGGGAVAVFDKITAVFTDCTFDGNTVERGGGGAIGTFRDGMLVDQNYAAITVRGGVYRNNETPLGLGGAIYCGMGHKVLITGGALFVNNTEGRSKAVELTVGSATTE